MTPASFLEDDPGEEPAPAKAAAPAAASFLEDDPGEQPPAVKPYAAEGFLPVDSHPHGAPTYDTNSLEAGVGSGLASALQAPWRAVQDVSADVKAGKYAGALKSAAPLLAGMTPIGRLGMGLYGAGVGAKHAYDSRTPAELGEGLTTAALSALMAREGGGKVAPVAGRVASAAKAGAASGLAEVPVLGRLGRIGSAALDAAGEDWSRTGNLAGAADGSFGGLRPGEAASQPADRPLRYPAPAHQPADSFGGLAAEEVLPDSGAPRALRYPPPAAAQGSFAGLAGDEASAPSAAPARDLRYPEPARATGAFAGLDRSEAAVTPDVVRAVRARAAAPAQGSYAGLAGDEAAGASPTSPPALRYPAPPRAPGSFAGLAGEEAAAAAPAPPLRLRHLLPEPAPAPELPPSLPAPQPQFGGVPAESPVVPEDVVRAVRGAARKKPIVEPPDPALDFSLDAMGHRPRARGK